MDSSEAVEHLATIRKIMEDATRMTVLPGQAAIGGGILALVGSAVSYALIGSTRFAAVSEMSSARRLALILLWAVVAAAAIGLDILLTVRLAHKRGRSPWSRLAQLAAYAMGPSILVALILTIALGSRGLWEPVPTVWMMLYGTAIWMASILSTRAPGVLGLVFVAAGAITLFWAARVALIMMALTFGLAHVIYGIYLLRRFGE
jgi:hypothetical protein